MKDAGKVLSNSYLKMVKSETDPKVWAKLSPADKKKWTEAFMKKNLEQWDIVLENAKELHTGYEKFRGQLKESVDAIEKIVVSKRAKPSSLTSEEIKAIKSGEVLMDIALETADKMFDNFSNNAPAMEYRLSYWETPAKVGAITPKHELEIKKIRSEGIELSEECGKTGKLRKRIEEYVQRWAILTKELSSLQGKAEGKGGVSLKELTEQVKAFSEGSKKATNDLDTYIGKVNGAIKNSMGLLDKNNPKSFLEGLKLAYKQRNLPKAPKVDKDTQEFNDAKGLKTALGIMQGALKSAKGLLKTRLMAYKSLTEQIKDLGKDGEPLSKELAKLGLDLVNFQKTLDNLTISVDAAIEVIEHETAK